MASPTISLCMIVKNEANHLSCCLSSVRDAVDEIIVVDTGSIDDTVSIAESFGAKVISLPWNGDFSYSRNAGLAAAKGTWIFILDADEELDENHKEELRLCSAHLEYEGFFVQVHNHAGKSNHSPIATINPILRMFRNRPEHRFRGKIHEQIAYSITERNPNAALHISSVKIHHYGYMDEIVVQKNKIQRNLKLLEQELRDNPDDPFHHFNMAVEYMRMNDSGHALEHLRKSAALLAPETSYEHLLHKYEARCLFTLGEYQEAIQVCDRAISLFPDYTDLYHLKGVIQLASGTKSQAKAAFIRSVEMGPPPGYYHTESGIGTFLSAYALGQLFEESGDDANAIHWYTETAKHNSNMTQPLLRVFRIFKSLGMEKDIPRWLSEHFRINSPEAIMKVVKALMEDSCFHAASALLCQLDGEKHDHYLNSATLKCEILSGKASEVALRLRKYTQPSKREQEILQFWMRWLLSENVETAEALNPIDALSTLLRRQEAESAYPHSSAMIKELEFGIKAAYFNHREEKALELIGLWMRNSQADADSISYEAYRRNRTMIALADIQLGRLKPTSPRYSLYRLARQTLPLARGFEE